jgi:hypothetical protein
MSTVSRILMALSILTDISAGPTRLYVVYYRLSEQSVHKQRTLDKRDSNPERVVAIRYFRPRTAVKPQNIKAALQSESITCPSRYRIEECLERPPFLLVKHNASLYRVTAKILCSHSYERGTKNCHGTYWFCCFQ